MDQTPPNHVSRRRFLVAGGATVAGAAVLAACGPGNNDTVAHTGNQPSTSSTAVPPQPPTTAEKATDQAADIALLQTSSSLEITISTFYSQAISQGWIKSATALPVIQLFRDQHDKAATVIQDATTKAGGKAYAQGNAVFQKDTVDPKIALLSSADHPTTEADWLMFASNLEGIAAATYVVGAASFSRIELRTAVMSVGATASRHVTVLNSLANPDPTTWVTDAFQNTLDAVGSDELIGAKPA